MSITFKKEAKMNTVSRNRTGVEHNLNSNLSTVFLQFISCSILLEHMQPTALLKPAHNNSRKSSESTGYQILKPAAGAQAGTIAVPG